MEQGDGLPEGTTARIERLLEYYDPSAVDYALARFAVEKLVADLPDAAFEEHEVFTSAKFEEARLVEEALDRLAALDGDVEEAAKAALGALREARFDGVDATLAEAEDRSADVDARVWARSARAEAALVPGDATAAASHYATAAGYLAAEQNDSEGRDEATPFRSRAVGRLIRHADTFGGDGGWIDAAMEMCHANIGRRDMHQWNRGARQMDAGSAQLSAGRLKEASEALNLFLAAEYAFRIASWHFDRDRFPVDWAAAQNARGLAQAQLLLSVRGGHGRDPARGKLARGGGQLPFSHGSATGSRGTGAVGEDRNQLGLSACPPRSCRGRRSGTGVSAPGGRGVPGRSKWLEAGDGSRRVGGCAADSRRGHLGPCRDRSGRREEALVAGHGGVDDRTSLLGRSGVAAASGQRGPVDGAAAAANGAHGPEFGRALGMTG